jgi:DNA polymerase-3 subunit delta'
LPNALLLKGAEGIGKLDLALNFAQSILCEAPQASGLACLSCPSCHWFAQESNPDFRLIQPDALAAADDTPEKEGTKKASREISVDQIRALSSFVNLSAHRRLPRGVDPPAEAMNSNSPMPCSRPEEPTDKLLFLYWLRTSHSSFCHDFERSLSFAVPMPTRAEGTAWLCRRWQIPKPHWRKRVLPFIRPAQWSEGTGTEAQAAAWRLKQSAKPDALALAEKQKAAPVQVIQFLQQWCYDLASYKMAGAIRYNPQQTDLIGNLSKNLSQQALLRYLKELQVAKREAFHPLNPKLLFESILLAYQQMLLTTRTA